MSLMAMKKVVTERKYELPLLSGPRCQSRAKMVVEELPDLGGEDPASPSTLRARRLFTVSGSLPSLECLRREGLEAAWAASVAGSLSLPGSPTLSSARRGTAGTASRGLPSRASTRASVRSLCDDDPPSPVARSTRRRSTHSITMTVSTMMSVSEHMGTAPSTPKYGSETPTRRKRRAGLLSRPALPGQSHADLDGLLSPKTPDGTGLLAKRRMQEFQRLSPAEAFRQVAILAVGSLQGAFRCLDLNGDGQISYDELVSGCEAMGVLEVLVGEKADQDEEGEDSFLKSLFAELDLNNDKHLSLAELLGYQPIAALGSGDEVAKQWFNYTNGTASQPSQLVRKPRWLPGSAEQPLASQEEADLVSELQERSKTDPIGAQLKLLELEAHKGTDYQDRRRQMKLKLREVRHVGPQAQRALVKSLVNAEDAEEVQSRETSELNNWTRRLEGHIQGCKSAREELMQVKQQLIEVAPAAGLTKDTLGLLSEFKGRLGGGQGAAQSSRSAERRDAGAELS